MISAINQKLALNDGHAMPGFGYGCYKMAGDALTAAIDAAVACGYRMVDTASFYGNEAVVGQALHELGAKDIYIISKLWPLDFGAALQALERSLRALERTCLDAYLLHWPGTDKKLRLGAFKTLLTAKEAGRIRTLGVSNFLEPHLEELHAAFGVWAPVNQIECHPYFPQKELCAFCAAHNITVLAWSPLGRGDELSDPVIGQIAREAGMSAAQVILRWHIQSDRVPIPKSAHPARIRENADIFQFSLSPEQMARIDALARPDGRRGADPMLFQP